MAKHYDRIIALRHRKVLGMSSSTAYYRLLRDIIWAMIERDRIMCHRCGQAMTRDTYSLDHIDPWRNSPEAPRLYFDLTNVKYTHNACNLRAANLNKTIESTLNVTWVRKPTPYDPEARRARYRRFKT